MAGSGHERRVSVGQEPVEQYHAIDSGVARHSARGRCAGDQGNHLCNPIGPLLEGWAKGLWSATLYKQHHTIESMCGRIKD